MDNFKSWLINKELVIQESWWHGMLPALSLASSQPQEKSVPKEYIYGAKGSEEREPDNSEEYKRYKGVEKLTDLHAGRFAGKLVFLPGKLEESKKSKVRVLKSLDGAVFELIDDMKNKSLEIQKTLIDDASDSRLKAIAGYILKFENLNIKIKEKIAEMEELDPTIWMKLQIVADYNANIDGHPKINKRLRARGYEYPEVVKFMMTLIKLQDAKDFLKMEFFSSGAYEYESTFGAVDMRQIVEDITMLYELTLADMKAKGVS